VFAVFQAAMPLIGWAIGRGFAGPIQDVDHWVAFGLLGIIGLRMIHADMTPSDTDVRTDGWQSLILVALATSVDALAAGLSLTFLDSIITPVVVIGLVTFGLCLVGVQLGSRYRRLAAGRVQTVGGVILILIGTKILIEHLGLA
jgi:putative Mn2+ efflux pump MntP